MMRSSTATYPQQPPPPIMTSTNNRLSGYGSGSTQPGGGPGGGGGGGGGRLGSARETIHSGQFMVSDFEPESEVLDDEYEAGMPIPQDEVLSLQGDTVIATKIHPNNNNQGGRGPGGGGNGSGAGGGRSGGGGPSSGLGGPSSGGGGYNSKNPAHTQNYNAGGGYGGGAPGGESGPLATIPHFGTAQQYQQHQAAQEQQGASVQLPLLALLQQQNAGRGGPSTLAGAGPSMALAPFHPSNPSNSGGIIDGSLTKLFQCMTLAYRQKLTSPKWNRFKGVRLRWKDKIRLNNVIWRCWHMQFILKQRALVCQFAPPLDVDQHNKPEAVVMEGKYWKRKLSTVAAEYKKWRLFYRNKIMGWTHHTATDLHPVSLDGFDWNRAGTFGGGPIAGFVFDDDLLMDFSDTLFSSLSSQSVGFPNPRELTRSGMAADFIQPGLVQLQPSLDDFMDTLEPLQEEMDNMGGGGPGGDGGAGGGAGGPDDSDSLFNTDMMHVFGDSIAAKINSGGGGGGGYHGNVQQQQQKSSYGNNNMASYYPLASIGGPVVNNRNQQQQQQQGGGRISPSSFYSNSNTQETNLNQSHLDNSGQARNEDIFAVPNPKTRGKPRGRGARGSGRSLSGGSAAAASARSQQQQQQQPSSLDSSSHSHSHVHSQQHSLSHHHHQGNAHAVASSYQSSSAMVNSRPTLLSHLLSNNNSALVAQQQQQQQQQQQHQQQTSPGNGGGGGGGGYSSTPSTPSYDKMGGGGGGGGLGGSLLMQQTSPWNPKNAHESLNPNIPLNFNKTMMAAMDADNGGNISPPMLASTPSPPMGPPGGGGGSGGAGGPGSPSKSFRPKNDTEREHRRVCHINAEQKRRCNIKNGFDVLHSLIPQLSHNPNAKVSKAAMLQKGAEYIRQLKMERTQLKQEIEAHRAEVDGLNASINSCQSLLPATGAPVSRQRTNKMKEMFDQWVRAQTAKDWRFWIFSILIRPLLDSYNNSVSTASLDELCRTVLAWVDQHCSLVDLRPAVLNSLRYLCTTTDILTNPASLPEEALRAVNRQSLKIERSASNSNHSP